MKITKNENHIFYIWTNQISAFFELSANQILISRKFRGDFGKSSRDIKKDKKFN
jgi:hypothetical protein